MSATKICVVGSAVRDLVFYSSKLPCAGETREGIFQEGLGGKGFNQAVAARKAGEEVFFIGCVGDDSGQRPFIEEMERLGIKSALEQAPGHETGAAGILVDEEGRNQIVVALGANKLLSREFVHGAIHSAEQVEVLLLQGETNLNAVHESLVITKQLFGHATTIFNPAPAPTEGIPAPILNLVDILTPNETELAAITGADPSEHMSLERIEELCHGMNFDGEILVTLGERGAYYVDNRGGTKRGGRLFAAPEVAAVDTTGAGDAFNGAFAAALTRFQGDRVRAIRFALSAASLSVTRRGTSAAIPSLEEIELFLADVREEQFC